MPSKIALLEACLKYQNLGYNVDSIVADIVQHEDVACGRGWEGDKPGCTRAKKGSAAASRQSSQSSQSKQRTSKEEKDAAKVAEIRKKTFLADLGYGIGGVSKDTSDKDRAKLAKIRAKEVAESETAQKHGVKAPEIEAILRKKYGLDGGLKKKGFTKEEREAKDRVKLSTGFKYL